MTTKKGQLAENRVANWLGKQDWTILKRNYRRVGFEVDIIAKKQDILLVGEVKLRTHLDPRGIKDILRPRQKLRIQKGIQSFLADYDTPYEVIRFDLFIVYGEKLDRLARYKDISLSD